MSRKIIGVTVGTPISPKVLTSEIPDVITTALAQAKKSGEFDGKDGYTPQKNVDYFDGEDGTDGKPGKDGKDGITPHIGENGNWYIGDTDTNIPASIDYRTWIVTIQADEHGFAASHSSNEIYEWVESKGRAIAVYRFHYYTLVGCSEDCVRFVCHDEVGDDRYITLNGFRAYEGIVSHEGYVRTVNGVEPDENGNVEITIPEADASDCVKTVNGVKPDENGNVKLPESDAYGWEDIDFVNVPSDGTVEIWMKDGNAEVFPFGIDGVVKSVNGVEPDENGNVEITIPEADASDCVKTVNGVKPDENGNVKLPESDAYGWEDIDFVNVPSDGTVEIWMKDGNAEVFPFGIDGVVKSVNGVEPDESGNVEIPDSGGNVDQEQITAAVNEALAEAKASGEFDGYSPVRGKDYWTDADKLEIKSYVDDAILGGAW